MKAYLIECKSCQRETKHTAVKPDFELLSLKLHIEPPPDEDYEDNQATAVVTALQKLKVTFQCLNCGKFTTLESAVLPARWGLGLEMCVEEENEGSCEGNSGT